MLQRSSFLLVLLLLSLSTRARADPPPLDAETSLGVGLFGATGTAALRVGGGATRVGVELDLSRGEWFPGGVPTDDVTGGDLRLGLVRTLLGDGLVALELSGSAGLRVLSSPEVTRYGVSAELAADAVARVAAGLRVRSGLAAPVALVGGELDRADQRYRVGLDLAIARDTWLTADAHVGGAYGYDGDGAKLDAGAQLGLRIARLDDGRGGERRRGAGAFLATEWRALAIGGHVSHGPGFAVGAILLGGRLKLGLAGFNRPGPINGRTFATSSVDGQMHASKSTFDLRSDGNFIGLHAAPAMRLGRLRVELPVTLGQAAFGFYLHGADRDAVQGERVSAVENRLFGGRDSSFALGAELGLRLAYQVNEWLRGGVAVNYLTTVGYDTIVTDDYGGPSVAAGVELVP